MREEVVTTILGTLAGTGAGSAGVSWWARGGRRRTKIDTAQAITAAAEAVVELMQGQLGSMRTEIADARARAVQAEQWARLLVQIVQRQQSEGREMAAWIAEAVTKLREAHIEIRDAPTWTETVIPTSVEVTTTTTTTTTREG